VIPTGIDAGSLASGDGGRFRARHGLDADTPVIGHVGRLAREKNLEFLASAVAPVIARSARARCVIVGDGPEGPLIRSVFADAAAADRLVMTGKLTGQALLDAYAAMDLFVFCSLTETQGMVIAEAMAAGSPVIALDGSGVRDVVVDGANGRLLPVESTPRTAGEAVGQAMGDRHRREEWARCAREAAQRFDRGRCARAVIELYESLGRNAAAERVDWDWWDRLQARIEAEWTLISSKAESAGRGLGGTQSGTPR